SPVRGNRVTAAFFSEMESQRPVIVVVAWCVLGSAMVASRAGPAPHPSREDTSRTHRLLECQKRGARGLVVSETRASGTIRARAVARSLSDQSCRHLETSGIHHMLIGSLCTRSPCRRRF